MVGQGFQEFVFSINGLVRCTNFLNGVPHPQVA